VKSYVLGANGEAGAVLVEVDKVKIWISYNKSILSKNPDAKRVKSYVLGPNGEAGAVLVEVDEVSLHVPAHQRHDDPHPHSTLT
jgi:hypothetical protein